MEKTVCLARTGRENKAFRDLPQSIRAVEGEGNERKFIISFSSELPYDRWWGSEILDHSEGCVDLTRLNEIGCVLFNHHRDNVIGKINRAWIEAGRGEAEIEFDTDEESEKIFQKVSSGTLKGVSVSPAVFNSIDAVPIASATPTLCIEPLKDIALSAIISTFSVPEDTPKLAPDVSI